ncbi:formylglycine-generating enzyme family protein [Tenacibaculum agarivorans]|uniref:formylglycine-generating enzyme family protein n=1 Tax=Tenacibaculum agarivorans TaxID=1908389 RepID=UPI00094BB3F9|nr:formylglycine-generating enzyme family protein [Tenacibaculum agarivorans]
MRKHFYSFILSLFILGIFSCKKNTKSQQNDIENKTVLKIPEGMVLIKGGKFQQGALDEDDAAMHHEKPRHTVTLKSFLIDITEVTNKQFQKFINETGYITLAERPVDWEEIKKQLPPGTQKPHDSLLQPGSLVFKERPNGVKNLYDFSQWWLWKKGANWKHPNGPKSDIIGKENHPVVHIAYEDAIAYCKWAKRDLPTEAQWEYAARGNTTSICYWGNDIINVANFANTYTGVFPQKNNKSDGYVYTSPVASYPPNSNGLYDTSGNVWEWTSDWYDPKYYQKIKDKNIINPMGPNNPINTRNEKVIKGGSFLCNVSYCASYRISSRMGNSLDSSSNHKGFRTVINLE